MASQDATSRASSQQVDVEAVMALVRARAGQSGSRGAVDADPAPAAGGDREMAHVLRQVSLLCRTPQVDLKLGWKTPVIGHAWLVFRRRLHQEIRIYFDLLTRQQTSFNASVARGLAILAERRDDSASRDRLAALEAEVAALRREVAELRALVGGSERARSGDGDR